MDCRLIALAVGLSGCQQLEGGMVPLTVVDDPSLPRMALDDGTLVHLRVVGPDDAPVVMVLHGGPGADHRELAFLADLAPDFRVVLWDQRGAGLSERLDADVVGPALVDDVLHVADHFSPHQPVHLLGYSWGGILATAAAQAAPERVDRMVLIEPGGLNQEMFDRSGVTSFSLAADWLNEAQWTYGGLSPDDHARMDLMFGVAFVADEQDRGVDPLFWRYGVASFQGAMESVLSEGYDVVSGLSTADHPVRIITGGSPHPLGTDFQEQQARFFGNASVVEVPGEGHGLVRTAPGATLAAVRAGLTDE